MNNKEQDILWLLQQPGFKEWVMHPTEANNLYWQKWLEKHPDQQETVAKAREFMLRMRFREKQLSASEIDALLGNIIAAHENKSYPFAGSTNRWQWLKVAAILALIFTFSFIIYKIQQSDQPPQTSAIIPNVTKSNPSGQKSQVMLPDGTVVQLNADSRLIFPETFADSARIVQLSGEAFFDVAEDTRRPFRVKAENVVTTALGTTFNINAYPETSRVHVALLSGKVEVKKDTLQAHSYLLDPGEKIMFDQKTNIEQISTFDNLREFGWKDGILIFENTSFPDFLAELERWFGVEFMVQGNPHQSWHIEGKFDNESLEEILQGVSFTHNIQYEINGKQVNIKL